MENKPKQEFPENGEHQESLDAPEQEPTADEVINLHRALKEIGVDFEEIDVEHIGAMEVDEAIGHLFDVLLDVGVEDPEAYLKEKGILE
jgi:hypothetical protein